MKDEIIKLKEWIDKSDNIVFFGGAGVSTESGIPDFRSVDGLYNQKFAYPPETILSHTFFMNNTADYYEFHKTRMVYFDAEPNNAHKVLCELERRGKLKAVITQNIDGLHHKAGSKNVLELHGSVFRNYCMDCNKFFETPDVLSREKVPRCECGGIIKPDVVLYEESLNQDIIQSAISFISSADMLIIGGTSLNVYPAAGLINYYRGNKLVLINKSATMMDDSADLVISESLGEVLISAFAI